MTASIGLTFDVIDNGTSKLKNALALLKQVQNQGNSGRQGQLPTSGGGTGRSIPTGASKEASALGKRALSGAQQLSNLEGGSEKYKALIADLKRGEEYIIEAGLKPLKDLAKALERESKTIDSEGKAAVDSKLANAAARVRSAIQDYEVKAGDQLSARMQQKQLNAQSSLARLRSTTNKVGIQAADDNEAAIQLIAGASTRNKNLASSFENSIRSFTDSGGDAISTTNFVKDLSTLGNQAAGVLKTETAKSDNQLKSIFQDRTKTIAERLSLASREAFGSTGTLQSGDIFGAANQASFAKYAQQTTAQELKALSKKPSDAAAATQGLRGATQEELAKRITAVEAAYQQQIKQITSTADAAIQQLRQTGSPEAKAAAEQLVREKELLVKAVAESLQKDKAYLQDKATAAAEKAKPKVSKTSEADKAAADTVKAQEQADKEFVKSMARARSRVTSAQKAFAQSFRGATEQDYDILAGRTGVLSANLTKKLNQTLTTPVMGPGGSQVMPFQGKLGGNFVGNLLSKSGFDSADTAEKKMAAVADASAKLTKELMGLGLSTQEVEVAEKEISLALGQLTTIYKPLVELTEKLNISRLQEIQNTVDVLKAEGKYEEALALLTSATLRKAGVGVGGKAGTGQRPGAVGDSNISNVGGMSAADQAAAGLNPDIIKDYKGKFDNLERDRLRAEERAARSSGSGKKEQTNFQKFQGFASKIGAVAGVFNIVAGAIGSAVQGMTELVERANRLEKASATISALSGSTKNYTSVLAIATKQQAKFGGSLEENLQGFVSLVPVAKRYGLDLQQIDNIARRLAIVDPLQGFSGAAIALKEFFSGDITSLSRRFEIDRKTLNSIKEAGSKADQLKALDDALTGMGISQQVLAARTATAAGSFDRAGAAWDNYLTLVGQGAQEVFKGAADAVANMFGDSGAAVAENLRLNEALTQQETSLGTLANRSSEVYDALGKLNDPTVEFIDDLGEVNGRMTSVKVTAQSIAAEFSIIGKATNRVIDNINKIRRESGKTDLARFEGPNADARASTFARAASYLGPANAEATRETGWFGSFDPNEVTNNPTDQIIGRANQGFSQMQFSLGRATADTRVVGDVWSNQTKDESGRTTLTELERIQGRLNNVENVTAGDAAILTKVVEQFTKDVAMGTISDSQVESIVSQYGKLIKEKNPALTNLEILDEIVIEQVDKVSKGYMTAYDAANKIIDLASTPVTFTAPSEYERLIGIRNEYEAITKEITDSSFATATYSNALATIEGLTQQQAESAAKLTALTYEQNDNQARTNALASNLFNVEGATAIAKENVIRKINEATRLQTRLTLEENKSVSAIGAMGDKFGSFLVDLEKAATLAVEFKNSMADFATGSLLSGLSLQDQLNFSTMRMTGGIPGYEPKNTGDVFSQLTQTAGLRTQVEQEQLDAAKKQSDTADDIKKMNEDFFDDQNKARAKHDKEMKELEEDHLKKMEELRRESEVSKRSNEVGFYESLFGMDNLSAEQVAQAGAEYQSIKAEATTLRNQGQFEKAAAVESVGKEGILNKYGDLEKKARLTLDIQEADEETAELNKEMAKAKDADAREEIQKKIDKIAKDKLIYENEIAQINALETIKKNLYEAELLNARTLQESETENYKIEVGNRKKDFEDAEKEKTLEHGKQVKERMKAEDGAAKAQISNLQEVITLMRYAATFTEEAYARTLTGQEQKDAMSDVLTRRGQYRRAIETSTSAIAPDVNSALTVLSQLGPSVIQNTKNMLTGEELVTSGKLLTAQTELKTSTDNLKDQFLILNKYLSQATITIVRQPV